LGASQENLAFPHTCQRIHWPEKSRDPKLILFLAR
jgi:hypothetical protein